MMKKRTKGILKIAGISIGSLIAIVLIVIAIVINLCLLLQNLLLWY